MCGKYNKLLKETYDKLGSPPHVREILHSLYTLSLLAGITPACAGNTLKNKITFFIFEDHPRMCGKYIKALPVCPFRGGSPPHVREILNSRSKRDFSYRITPACAGNTLKDPSMTLPAI